MQVCRSAVAQLLVGNRKLSSNRQPGRYSFQISFSLIFIAAKVEVEIFAFVYNSKLTTTCKTYRPKCIRKYRRNSVTAIQ